MMMLLLVVVLSALATQSSAWVPCGDDNKVVTLPTGSAGKQVWVKYVSVDGMGTALFRQVANYAVCSKKFIGGDPSPGKTKRCMCLEANSTTQMQYYGQQQPLPLDYPNTLALKWQRDSTMLVKPGVHILSAGIKDTWSALGLVGDEVAWTSVKCDFKHYGERSGEAYRHCELSEPMQTAAWQRCASHNGFCKLTAAAGNVLKTCMVRYGTAPSWTYQIAGDGQGKEVEFQLKCDTNSFVGATGTECHASCS
jgi:hypothetical protein